MKTSQAKREEHDLLKREIEGVWDQFPIDMKRFIVETKKQKLQVLYMIQDWAKKNNQQVIVDLIAPKIERHEANLEKMKQQVGE